MFQENLEDVYPENPEYKENLKDIVKAEEVYPDVHQENTEDKESLIDTIIIK
tara:strand:- start:89 stop:244 length:156 start_codon:yes stop_codon:yes gene_type:complete